MARLPRIVLPGIPHHITQRGNFAAFLGQDFDEQMTYAALRKAEAVGRPVGSKDWIADMEARTGKAIASAKRGPAPKASG